MAHVDTAIDWTAAARQLEDRGWALLPGLVSAGQCAELASGYDEPARFRTRIVMARHGFGRGEYQYFAYPLPPLVQALRTSLYEALAPVASAWDARLGHGSGFPSDHASFLERCRRAGQARPTPLLLRYGPGDFNCLHQDVYGECVFPFQVAVLLARPGHDFTGGEFVMTEQRPRQQSRVMVVPLGQGDGVVFAVRHRPVQGTRGVYRATLRHGVSEVREGRRHTLGLIFHDAQ